MNYDAASGDGNTYILGLITVAFSGAQTVNALAFNNIGSGVAVPVISGQRYKYRFTVTYHGNQAAGQPVISLLHSTPAMTFVDAHEEFSASGAGVLQTNTDASFIDITGPTLTTGRFFYRSEGWFQPSANGSLTGSVACSIAADTWVIEKAFMEVMPAR
jgi:hypothetical protein